MKNYIDYFSADIDTRLEILRDLLSEKDALESEGDILIDSCDNPTTYQTIIRKDYNQICELIKIIETALTQSEKNFLVVENGKYVTIMFIDTIIDTANNLYHNCIGRGKEKTVCIDEEHKVYAVAITVKRRHFLDIYEMANFTVKMLREYMKIDLSKYQEKYLNILMYEELFE